MSMIGKISGIDWSTAPLGTTHAFRKVTSICQWYKFLNNKYHYYNWVGLWRESYNYYSWCVENLISKEEDLGMNIKQVKSIADLEVGMFLKKANTEYIRLIIGVNVESFETVLINDSGTEWQWEELKDFISWSYTYNGDYTPIVKEVLPTPEQLKIKELEETIANASKQLQELKEIKK